MRGAAVAANPADLLPALVLGGAVLLWVAGFDIIYACQDVEFDRQAAVCAACRPGWACAALAAGGGLPLGNVVLLACCRSFFRCWAGFIAGGVLAVAVLLVYEHWLVRPDDLTRVNVAFFNVNAVVSMGLFGRRDAGFAGLTPSSAASHRPWRAAPP